MKFFRKNKVKKCENCRNGKLLKRNMVYGAGSTYDISKIPHYCENILEAVGNTPLVKLQRIPKDHGVECNIFVKCEFMNPGGSIKDRIAVTMVKDAKENGHTPPNTRFVEPTSGNTGIGLALVSTIYGYDCTIVTTDKSSNDKIMTTMDLGSEVIQAPHNVPHSDPRSAYSVVKKIVEDDPHAICLNQFENEINPHTHYMYTAEEILNNLNSIDLAVMGTGTGGTLTGVAKRIKEIMPKCKIAAVDPLGSTMFDGGESKPFLVEGIGGDFVPGVLDKTVVDVIIHPTDGDSFNMARELIKKEGLLCGGSSGAAIASAIEAIKKLGIGKGQNVVVILPDGIRNYMDKFVTDQWMEAYLFKDIPERDYPWWHRALTNLDINKEVPIIAEMTTCLDALHIMGTEHEVALVTNDENYFIGTVSKNGLRFGATNPKRKGEAIDFSDPVNRHMDKNSYKIIENHGNPTVGLASRILDIAPIVVVVEENKYRDCVMGYYPKGIITHNIVLDFIIKHQKNM